MASTSMRNALQAVLDFEHPEKNEKGMLITRNKNFTYNNMTVDKVELLWFLYYIHDAIFTEGTIARDGSFVVSEPRLPGFV